LPLWNNMCSQGTYGSRNAYPLRLQPGLRTAIFMVTHLGHLSHVQRQTEARKLTNDRTDKLRQKFYRNFIMYKVAVAWLTGLRQN